MSVRAPSRTEALETFGRSFKASHAALRRLRGRETQRPGELSHAQYSLLFALRDDVPRSVREIADAAAVSPATAVEMLDALAAAGLVVRTRSTQDKRIVLTSLSERGRTVVDERRARFEPRWRAALQQFSQEELLVAASVLDQVQTMFDELADEG